MQRRDWIKLAGAGSIAVVAPNRLLGDTLAGFDRALSDLVGTANVKPDDRIELFVPEDAANGAVVPVGVTSKVPNTLKIVLLINNHVRSKVATLDTSNAMLAPRLSTHLQLESPATITALVHSKLGWFSNSTMVKTLGESCET